MNRIFIYLCSAFFLLSCWEEKYFVPKPRQYPRIDFPDRHYMDFEAGECPLLFHYPSYATVKKTVSFFEEDPIHPCWFDIEFGPFNGQLHCSYYTIGGLKDFDVLIDDAFKFAGKHDIKAHYRRESIISNEAGLGGILFEIDGPVASPLQFFVTDSVQHFFRASLYFRSKVNPDSMAPVHAFINDDVLEMIRSFRFK
ncbi:MAG TPA: hypothetical protein PKC30_00515 [Saprospiraceae bacterium]|nr:hypothetical protein [Saprospiraceae bacterium]